MQEEGATFFNDVADVIGNPFFARSDEMIIYISGDINDGTGSVQIQRKGSDGEFHNFPTLTYIEADAWVVRVNVNAQLRIVVSGAISIDVEMV